MPDDASRPATPGAARGGTPGAAQHGTPGAAGGPAGPERTAAPAGPVRSWRVSGGMTGLKVAGAAGFGLVAAFSLGVPVRFAFAGVACLALAGYAVRDLVVPVRLRADPGGVTVVVGFAGRRRIAWSQVERVRVDEHRRFGLRSELLEIDTGDTLYLFSPYDLDAPPSEVAGALAALRTGTAAARTETASLPPGTAGQDRAPEPGG